MRHGGGGEGEGLAFDGDGGGLRARIGGGAGVAHLQRVAQAQAACGASPSVVRAEVGAVFAVGDRDADADICADAADVDLVGAVDGAGGDVGLGVKADRVDLGVEGLGFGPGGEAGAYGADGDGADLLAVVA